MHFGIERGQSMSFTSIPVYSEVYVRYCSISRINMGISKFQRSWSSVLHSKTVKLRNCLQLLLTPALLKQASNVTMDGRLLWMCMRLLQQKITIINIIHCTIQNCRYRRKLLIGLRMLLIHRGDVCWRLILITSHIT